MNSIFLYLVKPDKNMDSKPFTPIIAPGTHGGVQVGGYVSSSSGKVSYGGTVTLGKGGVSGATVGIKFKL
jgi:hypothetical protein